LPAQRKGWHAVCLGPSAEGPPMTTATPVEAGPPAYDDDVTRKFVLASVLWAAVGMTMGVIIALQLAWWPANAGVPWLSFGRLRPLHTNAVIFAFACNVIFAGIYYSLPRLLKTPMWSPALSRFHFWGWQAIIVSAAVTLPMGMTQSKEYAELIWPIDVAIAVVFLSLC